MALWNATVFVLGNAWVCSSRPAPGSTGSEVGDGRGLGLAGGGLGDASNGGMLAADASLTGRAEVPLEQAASRAPSSREHATDSAVTATARNRGVRTLMCRHFMEDEVPGIPPSCQLNLRLFSRT